MRTFEIDIPDKIYLRGIRYAEKNQITFSEVCTLSMIELLKMDDGELENISSEVRENNTNDE